MPLQIFFYLALADPTTVVAVWDHKEDRLRVVRISGGGRLIEELRKHAEKADLHPEVTLDSKHVLGDPEVYAWTLLHNYEELGESEQDEADAYFANLFSHIDIEIINGNRLIGDGLNSVEGLDEKLTSGNTELRFFLRKTDGSHTNDWVWKDTLRHQPYLEQSSG